MLGPVTAGVLALVAFVLVERRVRNPMLPLELFRSRQFSAANAVTLLLYAAITGAMFLVVVELQTVAGLSPLEAGTALLPITVMMVLFAARFGALGQRIGPRLPMSVGPLISCGGLILITRLPPDADYLRQVFPAVVVFGLGLAVFVAPLTATTLAAVPSSRAGIASAVNNTVARAAGLLAVAALPVIAGLGGDAYDHPDVFLVGFRSAIWICAGLLAAGGLLAALTIRNPSREAACTARADCATAYDGAALSHGWIPEVTEQLTESRD